MSSPLEPRTLAVDLRTLDLDESDPDAGISPVEWRQAEFIEAVLAASPSPRKERWRFISIAIRAYKYRLVTAPPIGYRESAASSDRREMNAASVLASLPSEWLDAWLWGYRWQPSMTPHAQDSSESRETGSRAILDAVSPAVRDAMLESLEPLGIKPV